MFGYVWEYLVDFCTDDELLALVFSKSRLKSNALYYAAVYQPHASLAVFFEKVRQLLIINESALTWLQESVLNQNILKRAIQRKQTILKRNILSASIFNDDDESIKFIFHFYQQEFNNEELAKILMEKDEFGKNYWHAVVYLAKSKEILEFIFDETQKIISSSCPLKDFLLAKRVKKTRENALMMAIHSRRRENFLFMFNDIYSRMFSNYDFIFQTNYNRQTILHIIAQDGFDETESITEFTTNFRNDFHIQTHHVLDRLIEFIEKDVKPKLDSQNIAKLFLMKDNQERHFLHVAAMCVGNHDSIKNLLATIETCITSKKLRKLFMARDFSKRNSLEYMILYSDFDNFDAMFDIYKKHITPMRMKKIISPWLKSSELSVKGKERIEQKFEQLERDEREHHIKYGYTTKVRLGKMKFEVKIGKAADENQETEN